MIKFLLKKTFYDLFDNLLKIAAVNLGFLLSSAFAFLIPSHLPQPLSLIVFIIILFWIFIYAAAAASCLKEVSDYQSFSAGDFFRNLKRALPTGLFMGALSFLLFFVVFFAVPFYLSRGNFSGAILASLSFWISIAAASSLQFFPAICFRLKIPPFEAVKKCFFIFIDNPGFSFFSLFFSIFLTVLILPSPSCPLLYLDEALRLRLLKYKWLEENPDARRKKIPWKELLASDIEKTGKRSFKDLVFPWKQN